MLLSVAIDLSSNKRRFFKIAVWEVELWACGMRIKPTLRLFPPSTACTRLSASSTESAPRSEQHISKPHATEPPETFKPKHAKARDCNPQSWLSTLGFDNQPGETTKTNWTPNIGLFAQWARKRWSSHLLLLGDNITVGQSQLFVGATCVTVSHQLCHCPLSLLVSSCQIVQVQPTLRQDSKRQSTNWTNIAGLLAGKKVELCSPFIHQHQVRFHLKLRLGECSLK